MPSMRTKRATYFLTASLTVFSQSPESPDGAWGWSKLIAACITGGLIALRALESKPEEPEGNGSPNI